MFLIFFQLYARYIQNIFLITIYKFKIFCITNYSCHPFNLEKIEFINFVNPFAELDFESSRLFPLS